MGTKCKVNYTRIITSANYGNNNTIHTDDFELLRLHVNVNTTPGHETTTGQSSNSTITLLNTDSQLHGSHSNVIYFVLSPNSSGHTIPNKQR